MAEIGLLSQRSKGSENVRRRSVLKGMALAISRPDQLGSLLWVSGLVLAPVSAAMAAPPSYQTQVNSENPYVFYRFNDDTTSSTTAVDTSGNGRNGTYVASPTGNVAGVGTGSDNAVSFNGTTQYVDSPLNNFSTLIANSSYEFVFKTNAGFSTATPYVIFGSANLNSTANISVSLNSNASGTTTANNIRLFLRQDNGLSSGFAFVNATLLDGNYHDLLFTYSASPRTVAAYVDGVAQTLTAQNANAPGIGTTSAFVNDPDFGANNNRGTALQFSPVTMDEAALYTTALTSAQALANATAAGTAAAAPVPEPATLGALAVAASALVLRRRRKA